MERLTTDNPNNNSQTMMNYAYDLGNRVTLRYANGSEDTDLCEYIAEEATKKGCATTADEVMGGECTDCDCPLAILNATAIQAAELRARLKSIEDILGPNYDLDTLREVAEAYKADRFIIRPIAKGETVYEVVQLPNREAILLGVPRKIQFGRETSRAAWLPWGVREKKMSESMYSRWGRSVFPDKDTADETAAMWNQNDENRRRKINEPQF